jgi:hypothetical protein
MGVMPGCQKQSSFSNVSNVDSGCITGGTGNAGGRGGAGGLYAGEGGARSFGPIELKHHI